MLKMQSEVTRALDDIEFISSRITESTPAELGRLESIIKTLCRTARAKVTVQATGSISQCRE